MAPFSTHPAGLLIRPAEWNDHEIIYSFLCELENIALDRGAFQSVFRHNLAAAHVYYLVAETDGMVVGFLSCHVQYLLHHAGKVGEIQELFVLTSHRNQRVGRQLISALEAIARHENLINLEVTANRIRTDTHRFYAQLGFQPTHYKFVKTVSV